MALGPVMVDLVGVELTDEEAELLKHPNTAGIILFSRNFVDYQQLVHLIQQIRHVRNEVLIAVDHEGGRVQRFKEGFTRLPALATLKTPEAAKQHALTMARELLTVGVDLSFAPVLDLDYGVSEVIGDRSFSADLDTLITLARCYINGMHEAGMAATGKHFPGHGFVSADSHYHLPIDERDEQTILEHDVKPFSQLSNELDAIMLAHIIYSKVDERPASFSPYWIQKVLREQLKFEGVVITDDLSMQAAQLYEGDMVVTAQQALMAGCDMILVCNNRQAACAVLEQLPITSSPRLKRLRAKGI